MKCSGMSGFLNRERFVNFSLKLPISFDNALNQPWAWSVYIYGLPGSLADFPIIQVLHQPKAWQIQAVILKNGY
jgi:hypothetical protein